MIQTHFFVLRNFYSNLNLFTINNTTLILHLYNKYLIQYNQRSFEYFKQNKTDYLTLINDILTTFRN